LVAVNIRKNTIVRLFLHQQDATELRYNFSIALSINLFLNHQKHLSAFSNVKKFLILCSLTLHINGQRFSGIDNSPVTCHYSPVTSLSISLCPPFLKDWLMGSVQGCITSGLE
jgi:hypothetical protein